MMHHVRSGLAVCAALVALLLAQHAAPAHAAGAAPPRTATADATVTINATAGAPTQALPHSFWSNFGSGHASLTLRADWQAQLAQISSALQPTPGSIGVTSVRPHGIFDDDMSVCLPTGPKRDQCQYNFVNVDKAYDGMLALGVRPYVELSFVPDALSKADPDTVFHYKGNISPPTNYSAWADMVTAFASHLIERYTLAEVSTWRFGVFNEPNCGFWNGTLAQYWTLYNYTARAIKAADPALLVGGPATCQTGDLTEFFDAVKASGAPVDFLDTHLYPTDPQVPKTRSGFVDTVAAASRIAAQNSVPLYLSEYNAGLDKDCDLDGPYAAAFAVYALAGFLRTWDSLGEGAGVSYWTFGDVFEEGGFQSNPYHNGYGATTVAGTPKPVFWAYSQLARLGDALAPVTVSGAGAANVDALAAVVAATDDDAADGGVGVGADGTGSPGTVNAVISNYAPAYLAVDTLNLTVTFQGACCPSSGDGGDPVCPTTAQVTRIDDTSGNARTAWQKMDRRCTRRLPR